MNAKMNEPKPKKGVSIRLDDTTLSLYEELMGDAAVTVSEGIRDAVQRAIKAQQDVDLTGLNVVVEFTAKETSKIDHFPELVGSLVLAVTPPNGLTLEDLDRLVFITPEFLRGHEEPFRIDSANFHRVVKNKRHVVSERVNRHVLSVRLMEGKWRAGVFLYSARWDLNAAVEEIRVALIKHVTSTVRCFLCGQLPASRHLTDEEIADLNETLMPHQLAS